MGALEDIQAQLHDIANGDGDPSTKTARLMDVRERVADVVGEADRLIAQQHRAREAAAQDGHRARLVVRENADLREGFNGLDDVLDEAGIRSHEDLDALAEEGLEAEALERLAGEFVPELEA